MRHVGEIGWFLDFDLADAVPVMEHYSLSMCQWGICTYQVITAMPKKALKQLKTKATTPRAVNPGGRGAGGRFSPLKSKKSWVLAAALPAVGIPASRHAL